MPRNRYTKVVREYQQARKVRQEKELSAIAAKLRHPEAEPPEVFPINKVREHRSARLEQKQRHKPKRQGTLLASTRSNYVQSESGAWQALSPARPGINETRDQGHAERSTT